MLATVPHVRPKDAERLRQTAAASGAPFFASTVPPRNPPSSNPSDTPAPQLPHGENEPHLAHGSPGSVDALALSAFVEVDSIRSTIESLRGRLAGLESILVAAFGKLQDDDERCAALNLALQQQRAAAEGLSGIGAKAEQISPALNPPSNLPYPDATLPNPHGTGDIFVNGAVHTPYTPFAPLHAQPPPVPPPHLTSRPSSTSSTAEPSYALSGGGSDASTTLLPPVHLPEPGHPHTSNGHGFAYGAFDSAERQADAHDMSAEATGGADGAVTRREELREEEVAASLSLEFMHALDETQLPASLVFDVSTLPNHPSALFPTSASLARVLPPFPDCQLILDHALEYTGWHHASVHAPTFRAELREFWAHPAETRFDKASPAWLALLFAQLCCGVRHMTTAQLKQLGPFGLTDEDMRTLTKTHLDASLACLYRSHFLENHQLHAVQAISVLVICCQDGAFSNLFPMLLSTGINLAQDLGYHRLLSEEAWEASVAGQPLEVRARSLIAYETRKRVFWALASQDWFNISFRRTTAVQPLQVTTPLPSNAHDEDLMTGILTNRPPSEYTVVSRLLIWIQIGRILQQVFQHIDENPVPSYDYVLGLDAQLQQLLDNVPEWMNTDAVVPERHPPNWAWMRTTFKISSSHKVLTLHRAFFRRFEPSRKRALDASRAILREAMHAGDSRMWTVPYHISAAASVVCLDLFQRGSPISTLVEERDEVYGALATLRRMSSFSAIAARGAALIDNLLAEESRLPPLSPLEDGTRPSTAERDPKRRRTDDGEAFHQHQLGTGGLPGTSVGGSLANLLVSPSVGGSGATPSGVVFPAATQISPTAGDPFPMLSASEPNGLGLINDLPPSFMSAFVDAGFDPLDGAIMGTTGLTVGTGEES
ncbi:hypothetical protein Rhopal_004822-T1 [Rhodotorula paludigena]|uniref:Xylanolytic transcriptional activator regulatory domain-containing protein n=1 Tax=Rhodotorula paludigena TaxID=86838 RepID=A0AAV5GPE2_9BASI|nr:hypothetical protein Rhopal_004822-T1 [Rhodotorula paludigena]